MEIDRLAYLGRLEGDERATFGIRGCPWLLHRGRRFCCRRLLPGAVTSEAAARVTSFFGQLIERSRMHVAATLVSQTTPLNIDWGCGLKTRMNMRMRVVRVRNIACVF